MNMDSLMTDCIRQTIFENYLDYHEGCHFYEVRNQWQHESVIEDYSVAVVCDMADLEKHLQSAHVAIYVPKGTQITREQMKQAISQSCFTKPIFWQADGR